MTSDPPSAPPGWYPDPEGGRQWRVWSGDRWSALTRSYGPRATAPSPVEALNALRALHRVRRSGVAATFAGLGLLVSILTHWPGSAHPLDANSALVGLDVALALVTWGAAATAVALRALRGRWGLVAVVPGLNTLALRATLARERDAASAPRLALTQGMAIALFTALAHTAPWLAILPAALALDHECAVTRALDHRRALNASSPRTGPSIDRVERGEESWRTRSGARWRV
ncbi:MAG: hypothetical protein ACP5PB_08640 [Acidimicrobiales bacterium]